MRLCQCGCGKATTIIDSSCARRGLVRGEYRRYVHGHHTRRGQPSSPWKGGTKKTGKGYLQIGDTGQYVHRAVAERALGRPLPATAVVHHINGVKSDNRPQNLVICENESYHKLLHQRQRALLARRGESAA